MNTVETDKHKVLREWNVRTINYRLLHMDYKWERTRYFILEKEEKDSMGDSAWRKITQIHPGAAGAICEGHGDCNHYILCELVNKMAVREKEQEDLLHHYRKMEMEMESEKKGKGEGAIFLSAARYKELCKIEKEFEEWKEKKDIPRVCTHGKTQCIDNIDWCKTCGAIKALDDLEWSYPTLKYMIQ